MVYDLTVPQFVKVLRNLKAFLGKGQEYSAGKKAEFDVLLGSRLAVDQFPLYRQIQIACDTAKLGVARLAGQDGQAPVHDDEQTSWPQLQTRIDDVIAYLNTFNARDFEGADNRKITHTRWEGKHLLGNEFLVQHLLPNFYFHVTTAYSILRHNGVVIGKKDYLGEMPYKN